MRIFSFEPSSGKPLTQWIDTKGVSHRVDPKTSKVVISPIFMSSAATRFACFHVGAGGFVPRHPATGPQLFAIVEGSGWVSGTDGTKVDLVAGQAAFWEAGEIHESGTKDGMKAIVVECESFDPASCMREIKR
jgi:quercetin dioxygenase-like cupin family protein